MLTIRRLGWLYALTIFLSAWLLFQVQPIIGKFVLPWFGGTPTVWTTCVLVFQILLFAGYAYAHAITRWLEPRQQRNVHLTLLAMAVVLLPIVPHHTWKPTDSDVPSLRIILLTLSCVGLPYFILSATGPLLQSWFSRTHPGKIPYRLYSLSNVGSLLALLTYPIVVEPNFSINAQANVWSLVFVGFALLCGTSAISVCRLSQPRSHEEDNPTAKGTGGSPALRGLWFSLSMTASLLLLATTNQVCLDVAVIPFLWVVPLALYLLSFILCFDSDRWYKRRPYMLATSGLLMATMYLLTKGSGVSLPLQVGVYFGGLFCCCMVCHGELARLRPHTRYLTEYYLLISAGGAAGGLFVGLVAPWLFVSYYELQFGLLCFVILFITLRLREEGRPRSSLGRVHLKQRAMVAVMLVAAIATFSQLGRYQRSALSVSRNFYGVLKVEQTSGTRSAEGLLTLAHGRIVHGSQFLDPARSRTPTTYYAKSTGIGQFFSRRSIEQQDQRRNVGIVGLGVGTLTAYGQANDRFRLYEINPEVVRIAREDFRYLRDTAADYDIVVGDARLKLEREPPQSFDVLVLDAFSGDAIPVHLLTREAMEIYLRHLKPDGVLAIHISNMHFNLSPVIAGLAQASGLCHRTIVTPCDEKTNAFPAIWCFLCSSPEHLPLPEKQEEDPPFSTLWTDQRSNLLEVLW
jgi:SAM-dependent methyltransferase